MTIPLRREEGPIDCDELVELVTDFLEERLDPALRERFTAHLGECDPCVDYVEQIRIAIRLAGATREEVVALPAVEALLASFRDWRATQTPGGAPA
jgi:predicted anti-sigma-YlaC factor YlaD